MKLEKHFSTLFCFWFRGEVCVCMCFGVRYKGLSLVSEAFIYYPNNADNFHSGALLMLPPHPLGPAGAVSQVLEERCTDSSELSQGQVFRSWGGMWPWRTRSEPGLPSAWRGSASCLLPAPRKPYSLVFVLMLGDRI